MPYHKSKIILFSTILLVFLFPSFDYHNSPLQQEDNSVNLLAPVSVGQQLSIVDGYNDPLPSEGCHAGASPDHCGNQQYGLDLEPSDQNNKSILAPLPGEIAWIDLDDNGNPKAPYCLGILTYDVPKLNLNICHFQTYSIKEHQVVSRGLVLGTRRTDWIHLSLDDANYGGIRKPIAFNGSHTIEGISFDPGPDTVRGPSFSDIVLTSTNGEINKSPAPKIIWWKSILQSIVNAWNDFWNGIRNKFLVYAQEPTITVYPSRQYTPQTPVPSITSEQPQIKNESLQITLEADLPLGTPIGPNVMILARTIIESRLADMGISNAKVVNSGSRQISVNLSIPEGKDLEQIVASIQQTGILEFIDIGSTPLAVGSIVTTDLSPMNNASANNPTSSDQPVWHTLLKGSQFLSESVSEGKVNGYVVNFELNSDGTLILSDFTSQHIGQFLGIVLDKKVISCSSINSPITDGKGIISANFTFEEANHLVMLLRYGSLPIPLNVIETKVISP